VLKLTLQKLCASLRVDRYTFRFSE